MLFPLLKSRWIVAFYNVIKDFYDFIFRPESYYKNKFLMKKGYTGIPRNYRVTPEVKT